MLIRSCCLLGIALGAVACGESTAASVDAGVDAFVLDASTMDASMNDASADAHVSEEHFFDLNDVSILFPLPERVEDRQYFIYLLPLEGETAHVFPPGLEEEIPGLFSTAPGTTQSVYQSMMVTAFRFVPCRADAEDCVPQIRLGAQMITRGASDIFFDEVALHLFYDLSAAEARALAEELAALKESAPVSTEGQPLFVHPSLAGEGFRSTWAAQLRNTILEYATPARLSKITGMGFVFDTWPFFSLRIADGHVAERNEMPFVNEANAELQSWDIFADDNVFGHIAPDSTVEDGPRFFVQHPARYISEGVPVDAPALQAAVDSVERVLNPRMQSAETMDCVSCHVARIGKARALASGVSFASSNSYRAPAWANRTNMTVDEVQNHHASIVQLGYFLRVEYYPVDGIPVPSVSERAILETIDAATTASALLDTPP